jgi:hypothetical protein
METIRSGTTKTSSLFLKVYIEIALGFFFFFSLIIISCKKEKEEVPSLTTAEVTSVNRTSATCGGEVTYEGTSGVISKGVCWSTSDNPTTGDNITVDGSGPGSFTSNITGLDPGTTYYIRAYATNSTITGYGETKSFSTQPPSLPELFTYPPYNMRCTSARSGGNITSDGDSPVIDCGICWSTSENPTLSDNYISAGTGSASFRITITGLEPDTDYYVRAYATNHVGTAYGDLWSFTTCIDINSNPVNPITITLWDKPLDTIRHYIQGKWRIVVIKGGRDYCYSSFFSEFTPDDKFITNVHRIAVDTYLIEWVRQLADYPDSSYRMELTNISSGSHTVSYMIKEIKYDSLIYHETTDDAFYYYGIKEQ